MNGQGYKTSLENGRWLIHWPDGRVHPYVAGGDGDDTPPAPEGTPATPPATPAEAPSIEGLVAAPDESGLDSSGLPDKTIAEIRKIRKDVQKYRQTHDMFGPATEKWNAADLEQLATALTYGPDDPSAIGQWMKEQASRLLGESSGQPDPVEEPAGDGQTFTLEQVQKLVEDKISEFKNQTVEERTLHERIEQIKQETDDLGFGPSHPMHKALLLIAKDDHNGDLTAAAEALKQAGVQPSNIEASTDTPPGAGTPIPPEGGTPAGSQKPRSPKEAAMERVSKVLPEGARGFADI